MRLYRFLVLLVFISVCLVACSSEVTPTVPSIAPTNTRSAPEILYLATPTVPATLTPIPSATRVAATGTALPLTPTTFVPTNTQTALPFPTIAPSASATAPQFAAPVLLAPLSKDVVYQKHNATIAFKWNKPAGANGNECYRLDVQSFFINGPKFYSDYFIVCNATEWLLYERGGADVESWAPFVPTPGSDSMEIRWMVTVVQASAALDKPVHRQTTPLSPPSVQVSFHLLAP